jgi:hypothetical protein
MTTAIGGGFLSFIKMKKEKEKIIVKKDRFISGEVVIDGKELEATIGKIKKETKKRISEIIGAISNQISVCLYKRGDFLFLGDIGKKEIESCIDYLKKEYYINHINYLIAPHHGTRTHWSNRLLDINAKNIIVCNGKDRFDDFEPKYELMTDRCLHTFKDGNIFLPRKYRIFPEYIDIHY